MIGLRMGGYGAGALVSFAGSSLNSAHFFGKEWLCEFGLWSSF